MIKLLMSNPYNIIVGAGIGIYVLYAIKNKLVMTHIYKLVIFAESYFIDDKGMGHKKYELVLNILYNKSFLKKFVSKDKYDKFMNAKIEKAVEEMKKDIKRLENKF